MTCAKIKQLQTNATRNATLTLWNVTVLVQIRVVSTSVSLIMADVDRTVLAARTARMAVPDARVRFANA